MYPFTFVASENFKLRENEKNFISYIQSVRLSVHCNLFTRTNICRGYRSIFNQDSIDTQRIKVQYEMIYLQDTVSEDAKLSQET